MRAIFIWVMSLLLVAGCKHTVPFTAVDDRCNLVRYALEQPLPGEKELTSVLRGRPGDMLFLSGGSQDGAFGAGFLDGWKSTGAMPEFSLVTGVSTGALQATGVFIGKPEITVDGYTIDEEADLLEAYVDGSALDGGLGLGVALTAIRRGAVADLIPLRSRLDQILTPAVLEAVASRYEPDGSGAYLLVGATDVDLGHAVAFDMTELASRYAKMPVGSDKKAQMKDCYIKALLASSIVPPGAKPVFIDNRMYIDGGVRYAAFDDRIGEMLNDRPVVLGPESLAPAFYIVLNSDGASKAECGKADAGNCSNPASTIGQRHDWDLLGLAFRSVDLLINQVERLSISRAATRASEFPGEAFFVRIGAEDLDDPKYAFAISDFSGKKTCNDWRADDDSLDNPLEFHRRYMRCMIEYGRARGRALDWDFGGVDAGP